MGITELAGIVVIATPASVAFTRYLIVRIALRDAKPKDRPAILAALPPVLDPRKAMPERGSTGRPAVRVPCNR